jgi:hypothetical protein
MPRVDRFDHQFVEYVPAPLDERVLYISIPFATVVHLCACGCGTKVVNALDPNDYSFTFDGETITLDPSIGNWDFHCRSHYLIRRSYVRWMPDMSYEAIAAGRRSDQLVKDAREAGLPSPVRVPRKPDSGETLSADRSHSHRDADSPAAQGSDVDHPFRSAIVRGLRRLVGHHK